MEIKDIVKYNTVTSTGTTSGDFSIQLEDKVNKPKHYTQGPIEVFEMILKVYGVEAVKNYCTINAFKYRMRAGYKDNATEDIEKALWYERKYKELSCVS